MITTKWLLLEVFFFLNLENYLLFYFQIGKYVKEGKFNVEKRT